MGKNNSYRTDCIYVFGDYEGFFYSPDGVGRIYFDTRVEAKDEVGNLPLVHATEAQMEDHWSDN